jgi:hypothetical protein
MAVQLKAVSQSEVAEVLRQILDSSLADTIDEVPFLTRLFVEVSNSSCPDDSNLIDLSEGMLPGDEVQKDEVIH